MKKIPLTQGQFALVDDSDYEYLIQWKWYALKKRDGKFYAVRNGKSRKIKGKKYCDFFYMHNEVIKVKNGKLPDHIDGNGLNNQRYNLREATLSQNMMNKSKHKNTTSKYKGVSFVTEKQKWKSQICINYKNKHLGYFDKEKDAAIAYNLKAIELFGDFAKLNIIN